MRRKAPLPAEIEHRLTTLGAVLDGTFEILVQAGLMSPGLGHAMVEMTGFHNVVVHEYTRIDAEVVVRILRDHLEDFRRFEAEALRWL